MNEIRAYAEDDLLDRQRVAWARGERPTPESFTNGDTSAQSHTTLLDLIYQEIVIREELGETPRPDDYFSKFPALKKEILIQFEVHAALRSEQEATLNVGDSQATAETLPTISIKQDK
jgi:eukaryotic-like serine/threonine-protein kinase